MSAAFAVVLLALALAGCATESKPAAAVPAPAVARVPGNDSPGGVSPGKVPYGNVSYGTIIAERAVPSPGGNRGLEAVAGTAAGDVRASILTAIGAASQATLGTGRETEFIIREDDGGTISVVQGAEDRLRRGERVRIIRGLETRLAPLGQA